MGSGLAVYALRSGTGPRARGPFDPIMWDQTLLGTGVVRHNGSYAVKSDAQSFDAQRCTIQWRPEAVSSTLPLLWHLHNPSLKGVPAASPKTERVSRFLAGV